MTKTLPLPQRLRQPARAKTLTVSGRIARTATRRPPPSAPVTSSPRENTSRADAIDALLDDLLAQKKSGAPSFCAVLLDARQ